MLKTDKVLRVKCKHGRTVQVVREHYIREDVPCYSKLCLANCQNNLQGNLNQLSDHVTHYVVPDCRVSREFLEILEYPQLSGMVFMQTVVHSKSQTRILNSEIGSLITYLSIQNHFISVQHEGGRRLHRRLTSLVRDPRKGSVIFHNEFQKYAYIPRKSGETLANWQTRSVYQAAVWYSNHLAQQMPVVMVTNDPEVVVQYGSQNLGVYVVKLQGYLQNFWPDLTELHQLYESLSVAIAESAGKGQDYEGYLPVDVLEAGIKSGVYIQGSLQVNKHDAQNEAFVRRTGSSMKSTDSESDILISGSGARNRSIHGDMVVVELLPRNKWRGRAIALKDSNEGDDKEGKEEIVSSDVMPTGRIVGILQRNWRDYVASFPQDNGGVQTTPGRSGKILVIPYDWRIPKIRINTRQAETLRDQRIIVRLDSWALESQYPDGHFVRSLGPAGSLETEVATILVEHGLVVPPFTESQVKELPANSPEKPWKMEEAEVNRRRDLRNTHLIFSIDPKGCEDVDDTLSVRRLDNGNLELGVHIADVTYFVQPSTLTDLEARSRATTVYLADRRYDMLPEVLSADLCSLISNVDRFAMSVMWEMNPSYEVVDVWYGRTIIRSSYKLFYEIAQLMSEDADLETLVENIPELLGVSEKEQRERLVSLRWAVETLMAIARALKHNRVQGGAVALDSMEVQIQLQAGQKNVENLIPKQSLEIHETIAECMIFANHWVAKKICSTYPNQALLRHHPPPRQEYFDSLVRCAEAKGFEITTDTNKDLAESLDHCVDTLDPHVNQILRSLATQAMSNAEYFSTGSLDRDQFFHYGLALDFYTHFTSPIRRYADVIVHRQLLAALGVLDECNLPSNRDLQELAQHINIKHRESQNAQKDSVEVFQALFFRDKSPDDECCTADGIIFQIRANGVLVLVPRYGLKSAMYLRSKDHQVAYVIDGEAAWTAGNLTQTDSTITVTTMYGSQVYALFDHVTVRIGVQQTHAHSSCVRLELLNNKPHMTLNPMTDDKQQKKEIIQEVRSTASRQVRKSSVDLGPAFEKWKELYGQTDEKSSFYHVLQSINDLAMLDV